MLINLDDLKIFFPTLIEFVVLAFIITRLLTFIPSFILSIVRSVKDRSIIYDDDHLSNVNLVSSLDEKTLVDKVKL